MAKVDWSNLKEYKYTYIVITLVVIAVCIFISKDKIRATKGSGNRPRKDGNGDIYYLGRGNRHDSAEELLDRIEWSTYLEKRVSLWQRHFVISLIIAALVVLLIMRSVPSPGIFVLLVIVIFIPLYAAHNLFYVHGDIYNDYYIKDNVDRLRHIFGFKKGFPSEPEDNIPDRIKVMNPK